MSFLDLLQSFSCGAAVTVLLILGGQSVRSHNIGHNSLNRKALMKLEKQLPVFLDTVSSGLSSGSSLLQSLESTGNKSCPPLGNIIQRLVNNVQAGMTLQRALEKTADNIKKGTMLLVLYSMAASYRSGGNMVRLLSLLAELCRERIALQEKIQARTAQSRMQGTILILVPFFFLILLLLISPDNLYPVINSSFGKKILGCAIVLQLLGILVIKRMLKQEILG